ncbi:hypothetical protein EGI16_11970 [Chryseobacterium sp. G0240]|nr:hypothetical protein EGI16_11970 [Chryseobacterium sp. G0240]
MSCTGKLRKHPEVFWIHNLDSMASLQKKVYDERPLKTEYELIPLGESFMEAIKYTAQWREM